MSQTPQGESTWAPTRDGRTLHAVVLPARSPTAADRRPVTVVFEAGAAARWSWAAVQPPVADFATAVAYDRSGLGRSAPDPAGRTLSRMADDLNDLLDHLEDGTAGRRFVLVGHSAGGPLVRLAAARRPARVGGLVLVDPTDEAAAVLFGPGFRRLERTALTVGGALARVGLLRLLYRGLVRSAPDDVRPALLAEAFTVRVMATSREIPVTVVSGARTGDGMSAAIRAEANAAHAVRAARSPYGRHVLAERSGHYVPLTDPELIVDEVRRLVHRTEGLAPD
ncbi:alpha/beta fold hydrolase [Pimelobacter sp. 30-1]|uniref:alpha/beta fold hydrolase n=1 Tax=Pimelobacter sp. 30-1 TaxID=2004991 RepID=UPI001C04203D|nr:alpha/beta fold hydrolase [Pimelobacter sp. 30-1]MBU2695583.1 alpha/beta hydrolase [Pimelobacter sp. 30-1]